MYVVVYVRRSVLQSAIFVSGTLFDTVYQQHSRALPRTTVPSESPSNTDANKQKENNQLYCGYCNIQYKTVTDLVEHCKQDLHKYAVFADSGRDVFWQFEPPPLKEYNISADG